jgi:peptidoglycan/xylan/chitin deacetylase (PgdA/CDA1 family)
MDSGLARIVSLLAVPLALCASLAAATAGECPGNRNALGTSRTIVVDPREHIRIGTMDYAETLPLVDREVVLTFDDGPLPPYSNKILDILAAECVKATYFMVGTMAREYPALVRRTYDEGHTVGTHSMSHPMRFRALSVENGNAQIDNGIAAIAAALGDPDKVAPFFRFPGFGHTPAAHEHAAERGLMVWGADVPADDWHKLGPREVARRAVQRLEYKGKGILLLHDIHHRTVEALPLILEELKANGFRIVHVVPASAERPATVTAASDWRPGSRPTLVASAAPVIRIAALQDLDADILTRKSIEELCSLNPTVRETTGRGRMAARKHGHATRMAHVEVAQTRPGSGKGKQAKIAHSETATLRPDIHAVQ